MPSTPSPIGAVEQQAKGENSGTWGETRLNEALKRLTEMGVGVRVVPLSGNKVLTTTNFQANESRWAAHVFTSDGLSAGATVTYPAETRFWWVYNNTGFTLSALALSSAVTVTVPAGKWAVLSCDGTDITKLDLSLLAGTLPLASLPAQANLTVLGNVSGSAAIPAAVTVINDATMATASGTTLATSLSMKGYIDTIAAQGDLATVAAISAQIVQVAGLETEILAVVANEANITAAPGAATAAAASATDASGSASAAAAAATLAQQWAANPEDSVVSGGLFSALHYAAKAADSAVLAATFDPTDYYNKTASDTRYATAAQGATADTALQPAAIGVSVAAFNDARITGAQQTSEKGAANGYASLGADGKVPVAQSQEVLPPSDYKAIGTYIMARYEGTDNWTAGIVVPGSLLVPTNVGSSNGPEASIAGSWRAMGYYSTASNLQRTMVWLRIS